MSRRQLTALADEGRVSTRSQTGRQHFSFVAFDGGYGHLPWLLGELDGEGEIFFAEVHSDQAIYLQDPAPTVVARRSSKGRAPRRLQTAAVSMTVAEWAATQSASAWGRLSIRDGEKGEVMADYLTQRVWAWDGEAPSASRWHLLVRREIDGTKLKFGLSNAKPKASLRRLAEMQGARHFVEQSFREAKGACGMAPGFNVRREIFVRRGDDADVDFIALGIAQRVHGMVFEHP